MSMLKAELKLAGLVEKLTLLLIADTPVRPKINARYPSTPFYSTMCSIRMKAWTFLKRIRFSSSSRFPAFSSPRAHEGAGPVNSIQKIAIIGSSGSGKSTFAKELSHTLHLPLFHLDSLYWKPNWEKTEKDAWIALQENLVQKSKWIIDGNYNSTLDIRICAADTIFFLNYSRITCISGVLRRYLTRKRADDISGCRERLSLAFLLWIWNYPRNNAPKMIDALQKHASTKRIFIFANRRELNDFIANTKTLKRREQES